MATDQEIVKVQWSSALEVELLLTSFLLPIPVQEAECASHGKCAKGLDLEPAYFSFLNEAPPLTHIVLYYSFAKYFLVQQMYFIHIFM